MSISGYQIGALGIADFAPDEGLGLHPELSINSESIESISFNEIWLDRLSILRSARSGRNRTVVQAFRKIYIEDQITVDRWMVADAAQSLSRPSQIRSFSKLLVDRGVLSDDRGERPIGVKAVYHMRKAEAGKNSRTMAFVTDWVTGYGVVYWKPIITLFLMLLAHAIFRTVLLWPTKSCNKYSVIWHAILGAVHAVDDKQDAQRFIPQKDFVMRTNGLRFSRAVFSFLTMFFITLWAVYLSQTTLR